MTSSRLGLAVVLSAIAAGTAHAQYTEIDEDDNPFSVVNVARAAPTIGDVDGDGDLDLLVGGDSGELHYYENVSTTSAPNFVERTGTANPFHLINDIVDDVGHDNAVPRLHDLDGDGLQDLIVGFKDGRVYVVLNVLGTFPTMHPIYATSGSCTASYNWVTYAGAPPNCATIYDIDQDAAPYISDVDLDGDLDIVVGGQDGDGSSNIQILYNTGGRLVLDDKPQNLSNFWNSGGTEDWVAPALGDLDGDGYPDLILGLNDGGSGELRYFLNNGPQGQTVQFKEEKGDDNPLDDLPDDIEDYPAPFIFDFDGDGDLDIMVNDENGGIVVVCLGVCGEFDGDAPNPPATVGGFNAVDSGDDPISGKIKTKISASAFSIDIAALNAAGTAVDTGYEFDRGLTVTLLDARDDSGTDQGNGCRSTWTPVLTLHTSSNETQDQNGILTLTFTYPDALRIAAIYVEDGDGVSGCGLDRFAIRPDRFAMTASDDNWTSPGILRTLNAATPTATPVHKAGRPFTLTGVPLSALGVVTPGYDGSPTVMASGTALGGVPGVLSMGATAVVGGIFRTDTATYSEVGAFTASIEDSTFAQIDDGDGSTLAERRIGPDTGTVGRFVPDDFLVVPNVPELTPACTGFTYLGQPLTYLTDPEATLTAVNAGGNPTLNYTGTLFRMNPGSVGGLAYSTDLGALDTAGALLPAFVTDLGAGQVQILLESGASLVMTRAAPTVPFSAAIALSGNVSDLDGVAASTPLAFGAATPGNGIAFNPAGGNSFRFGRMRIINAYGPSDRALDLPVTVEYFEDLGAGNTAFVRSFETCTTQAGITVATDIALDESQLGGGGAGQTSVNLLTIGNGAGILRLNAPNAVGSVPTTLNLGPSYPWLAPDTDNDGAFDDAASGLATFGQFNEGDRKLDFREFVR